MIAGNSTPTWGFNGGILGPTLRARRGEQVAVTVGNQLPESTSVHWHGMGSDTLAAQPIEASVKTAIAAMNTRRIPNRSAIQPLAGISTATVTR